MRPTSIFRSLALAALLAGTAGCFGPLIDPPQIPLSKAEQRAVLACQGTMSRQVAQLHAAAARTLDKCADRMLALRLDEERELNSTTIGQFVERREKVLEQCAEGFGRLGSGTTKMIDAIIGACDDVETLILDDPTRGDPLGLKGETMLAPLGGEGTPLGLVFTVDTVEELAASQCGLAVGWAEVLVASTYGRATDLAQRYYQIDEEDQFQELLQSFLDPRCELPDVDL